MNKVILVGRLTKDPELRSTASGVSVCSFTVACDRRFVKQGEEKKADFINCIAWQKNGESIAQYFHKGDRIALEGSLQVRSWEDQDGQRRYATEVIVAQWEFAQSKSETSAGNGSNGFACGRAAVQQVGVADNQTETPHPGGDLDGFLPIEDDDLPF